MRVLRAVPAAALCAAAGIVLAAPAQARSPVAIEGVDGDERAAILELFPDREAPSTLFDAERLAEEAADRAAAWLRAEGYYQGEATPEAEDEPPRARVRIRLGARFTLKQSSIAYGAPAPEAETQAKADDALELIPPGAPARAADVLAAEAAALSTLQGGGYPDAAAGERRVIVDHVDASMSPNFTFDAGERVRLGVLRVDPPDLFRSGFLERAQNWESGDLYTPDALARVRRDVAATGAVARVSTRLQPRANEPGVRDVVLEAAPAARNVYEFGAGYSTTEGFGAEAEWTRRNVTRRADTLVLSTTLAELEQRIGAELRRPHAAGLNRTVRLSAEAVREDPGPYVAQGVSIAGAIEAAPRLRFGMSYGVSLAANSYSDSAGVENALVFAAFGEVRRDSTGNPLDARDGEIITLRAEPSISTGSATVGFVRTTADARLYRSVGAEDRTTFAARIGFGWLEAFSGTDEDIPPDRRFYAGGGGSVRGYEYNSIYPQDRRLRSLDVTPGGKGLAEISLEARYRFEGPLGLVAFVDGGNAFDAIEDAADLRWGAGLGVRYDLGFAPLRVDLAVPLDREDGDPDYALYVSLGQAF